MSFQVAAPTNRGDGGNGGGGGRRRTTVTTMLETAMAKLHELNINLLALDFDQTIVDIHTHGNWKGTVDELAQHVRPELKQLMVACCHHNIHLCVVTFSGQVKIVRGVIEIIVGMDNASRIPIRGSDRSWYYEGGGSKERKQPYIASAVEELEQQDPRPTTTTRNGPTTRGGGADAPPDPSDVTASSPPPPAAIEITRNSTVLIDDDPKNVRAALVDGVRAIWFNPDKPHHLLQNIAKLV